MSRTNLTMMRRRVAQQLGRPNWEDSELSGLTEQNSRLWGMVEQYTGHPLLIDILARLIDAYNVPARDPEALAKAIQHYSAHHIKFFRERPERFQSPMRTVAWGIGDCDDKSIFVAASLRSFRVPVRLVILRLLIKDPKTRKKKPVGHVYPEAYLDGEWVALESVRPYPWGHDPAAVAKARGILAGKEIIGDKAESGAYA